MTTALLFLCSPAMVPLIELIPPQATAPCLVLVGTLMMTPIRDIDFRDLRPRPCGGEQVRQIGSFGRTWPSL